MIKPATRNVVIFSVLLLAMFALALAASHTRTKAETDDKTAQQNIASPAFSHESGFYKKSFELTMSCDPDCTIYYTLDGSDPDPEDAAGPAKANNSQDAGAAEPAAPAGTLRYGEPLQIDDASTHENVYSMNTDTSTGFYEDLIRRYSDSGVPHYEAPEEPVDKCTILRAIAVRSDGVTSDESTATYFVGKSTGDYTPCRVISIVTDPDNLFDEKKGIYVTGARFRNYLTGQRERWTKWDGNYYETGIESEREAHFRLFDTDGSTISAKNCAIRIHGNITRAYNQKSFSVFFRDENGQAVTLGADIFGTGYDPEELLLSNGGQNISTKFNNVTVAEALEGSSPQKHFTPAVLFLDGEYWGFYWITELFDEDWLAHYCNVDRTNLVAVKFDITSYYAIRSSDPRTREQQSHVFEEAEQYILSNDMADPDNYAKASSYLDMDDFIDYYAVEAYLGNEDWPRRNKEFWRTWKVADDRYSDGLWRSLYFDYDLALNLDTNGLQWTLKRDDLFAALWENESFRKQFEERICYFADHEFAPDNMEKYVDDYAAAYGPALEKSWERFFADGVYTMDQFNAGMENKKKFFKQRKAIMEKWFR